MGQSRTKAFAFGLASLLVHASPASADDPPAPSTHGIEGAVRAGLSLSGYQDDQGIGNGWFAGGFVDAELGLRRGRLSLATFLAADLFSAQNPLVDVQYFELGARATLHNGSLGVGLGLAVGGMHFSGGGIGTPPGLEVVPAMELHATLDLAAGKLRPQAFVLFELAPPYESPASANYSGAAIESFRIGIGVTY